MKLRRKLSVLLAALFFLFSVLGTGKAYAYLDPGTGSYLFQLLLGAFLGALFSARIFWQKIKTFFTTRFQKSKPR